MEQPNDATNVTSNLANGASVSSGKCEVSLLHNQEITFLAGDACLYSVVKQCALSLGWKLICEDANEIAKRNCHVVWIDRSFNDNIFLTIQPWQRINHFPGMTNICKKASMARNLELMKKEFPREYSLYPTTYVIPQNMSTFKSLFAPSGRSKSVYIIKPSGGAQGKGIFLTRKIEDLDQINSVCVAQQYIHNPLLIDKKKFDLRIYVLVTSCAPLRVYLFRGCGLDEEWSYIAQCLRGWHGKIVGHTGRRAVWRAVQCHSAPKGRLLTHCRRYSKYLSKHGDCSWIQG